MKNNNMLFKAQARIPPGLIKEGTFLLLVGVVGRGPWALGRLSRGCKKGRPQDTGRDLTRPWAESPPVNAAGTATKPFLLLVGVVRPKVDNR